MKGFAQLTTREKRLLVGGGAIVAVFALWVYVWQPIAAQRDAQQDRIARYLALIDIAQRSPEAAQAAVNTCTQTRPLAPRITQSAESAGITLARLDPEAQRLRITVTETDYASAVAWISRMEAQDCLRAVTVEMTRLTAPGQVSMRLMVEDAGT